MKTIEIIERILAHPNVEDILEKLEERLAEESQCPAANVLQAYLDRDVEAMFSAFTGLSMKNFLAVARITPDTTNLFGGRKEDALFQDIDSVEDATAPAPVQLRVFLDADGISRTYVKGNTPVEMEVVQTYISKYEMDDPENAGRADKLEDYEAATAEDLSWKQFTPDANNCADWKLRENKTFHICRYASPGKQFSDFGEFCLLDLEKLTVARWNDGEPEALFDLVINLEGQTRNGEVAIKRTFDTGLGFCSADAVRALRNCGAISHFARVVADNGLVYYAHRLNTIAASNYLYEKEEA